MKLMNTMKPMRLLKLMRPFNFDRLMNLVKVMKYELDVNGLMEELDEN